MIEIKRDEASKLEFEMQINGDAAGEPQVYFNLKTSPTEPTLCFKVAHVGNGLYSVNLPVLERYVSAGTYPCEISVILGDHFYIPLTDECSVKDTPKPVVSGLRPAVQVKAPAVNIGQPKITSSAATVQAVAISAPEPAVEALAPTPEPVLEAPTAPVEIIKPEPVKTAQVPEPIVEAPALIAVPVVAPAPVEPPKPRNLEAEAMVGLLIKRSKMK